MSTPCVRLQHSIPLAIALTLAALLAPPRAAAAAPSSPAFAGTPAPSASAELHSIFADAVDPWDDDIGKTPPPPPAGVTTGGDPLCGLDAPADSTDIGLCSAVVGTAQPGEDGDLFSFRLPTRGILTVEALSSTAVEIVLRDAAGHIVASSGGTGAPLRLVGTFPPGRYLLEVGSLTGEKALYAMTIRRPSRP